MGPRGLSRDERWHGQNGDADYDLQSPLAASHQALIYVNPTPEDGGCRELDFRESCSARGDLGAPPPEAPSEERTSNGWLSCVGYKLFEEICQLDNGLLTT